ncbi:MAG TPA: hypothetical protein VKZ63_21050 [Kofleriaceae bacterium]|nr:hypothetical protein [Kofleriaceae bacterium]
MKKRGILVAAALVAGAIGWWSGGDDGGEQPAALDDPPVSVTDQIWIDRMPVRDKDKIHLFGTISDGNIGVFNHGSAYEGEFTLFTFEKPRRGALVITMLQSDKVHTLRYKLSREGCPRAFDYCLHVKGAPRGPKVYGTMRDWRIEGARDARALDALVRERAAALR